LASILPAGVASNRCNTVSLDEPLVLAGELSHNLGGDEAVTVLWKHIAAMAHRRAVFFLGKEGWHMLSRAVAVNAVGHLEIAGCDSVSLAKQYGTPLYIMNEDIIRLNCRRYKNAFDKSGYPNWRVAYAGKAFLSAWICQVIGQEGLNLDVVSGGELYTALRAGFPAQRIVFHGSNKSRDEVMMGLEARALRGR